MPKRSRLILAPAQEPDELGYEGIQELVENRDRVSALRIWKALTLSERRTAVLHHCAVDASNVGGVIDALADLRGFRQQTIASWSVEKLAEELARFPLKSPSLARDLLIALHFADRRPILSAFLDDLDIAHENGELLDGALDAASPTREEVFQAANDLRAEFEARSVAVYFLTLIVLRQFPFSRDLWEWMQDEWTPDEEERELEHAAAGATQIDEQVDRSEHAGLTTLDRLLVFAAVNAAQGVEGSLSVDALDDVTLELVQLNSSRHSAFFHAGFVDALFQRPPRRELPAQNEQRLRWYWAGAIQGYTRRGDWDQIVGAYDAPDTPVSELGDGADPPSMLAVNWIVEALIEAGRVHEVAGFVRNPAIAGSPSLFERLLEAATRLLRTDEGAAARQILDKLTSTADTLEKQGFVPATSRFLEARRRKAHCHRQLREWIQAEQELKELLTLDEDPGIQAMIHADLGLIEGRFRMLSEVHLEGADPNLTLEELDKGRACFEQAAGLDSRYSSHGHFCLGVLHVGDEEWEQASIHLEQARAGFRAHPERYSEGGLVARADTYLGVALSHILEAEKLKQAANLLTSGLGGGVPIPRHLAASTLKHLSAGGDALVKPVVRCILEQDSSSETLDTLMDIPEALSTDVVGSALYARACGSERGEHERARDLRAALEAHLANRDADTASEILDRLERLALRGVGTREMIGLLAVPDRYEPAWSVEDAAISRAKCLEAEDEYEEAAAVLDELAHRLISQERHSSVAEAQGLLERIDTYPISADVSERLRERVAALHDTDEAPRLEESRKSLKVLVVGGDERNAKDDDRIRELLAEETKRVRVEFIRPGWSGNWGKALEDTKRALEKNDALVLMRFIRTEFGKQVRKECEVPWRFCYGAGRNLLVRTILEAAAAADG